MKIFSITSILLFLILSINIQAQTKGEPPEKKPDYSPDSVMIFDSPRPLIDTRNPAETLINSWGGDLIFSSHGFGAGVFYRRYLEKDLNLFINLYITGARNTDEFEKISPTGEIIVPKKINRLFMFPLTFGLQKNVFSNVIFETFRPFFTAGFGPTFIISTPYVPGRHLDEEMINDPTKHPGKVEFFKSFGSAEFYTRLGGFAGIGADIGKIDKSVLAVNVRYYYIPFGGDGLESIQGNPINDFGGLFLSLTVGQRFD